MFSSKYLLGVFYSQKNLQSAYLNCIWRNCRLIDILSPHSIERKLKVNRINLHRIYANLHFCLFVQRGQCNHYFKTLFQKDFFCKAYYQELQKKKSNFFLKNYITVWIRYFFDNADPYNFKESFDFYRKVGFTKNLF